MTNTIEDLVRQEIVSHYLPEELPVSDQEFLQVLPELASASAGRLHSMVRSSTVGPESENMQQLISLLQAASDDPHHPLLASIARISLIDWEEEPGQNLLQQLFRLIIEELQSQ